MKMACWLIHIPITDVHFGQIMSRKTVIQKFIFNWWLLLNGFCKADCRVRQGVKSQIAIKKEWYLKWYRMCIKRCIVCVHCQMLGSRISQEIIMIGVISVVLYLINTSEHIALHKINNNVYIKTSKIINYKVIILYYTHTQHWKGRAAWNNPKAMLSRITKNIDVKNKLHLKCFLGGCVYVKIFVWKRASVCGCMSVCLNTCCSHFRVDQWLQQCTPQENVALLLKGQMSSSCGRAWTFVLSVSSSRYIPEQHFVYACRLIGHFVAFSPEFCFVAEDEERVCGYVVAAQDAKDLACKTDESWVPSMQNKYPKPAKEELSPAEVSVPGPDHFRIRRLGQVWYSVSSC